MADPLTEAVARAIAQTVWRTVRAGTPVHQISSDEWDAITTTALAIARPAIRNAALEEAAQVAEREGVYPALNIAHGGPDWYRHGKDIAAAIRKLKG